MNITISKEPLTKPRLKLDELEGGKFYTSSLENEEYLVYRRLVLVFEMILLIIKN